MKDYALKNIIYQSASENNFQPPMPASEVIIDGSRHFDNGMVERSHTKCGLKSEHSGFPLKFPPCRVCGGKASGLHYGLNSCEACKGFFRRYLVRKENYICSKDGKCIITSVSRGNCSGCRLKKCIELGMSKHASRLGRYTLSQRTKTIMEVKKMSEWVENATGNKLSFSDQLQHTKFVAHEVYRFGSTEHARSLSDNDYYSRGTESFTSINTDLLQSLILGMEDIRPFGERLSLDEMRRRMQTQHEKYSLKTQIFGTFKAIPADEYYSVLKNHGIDLDGRLKVLKESSIQLEGIIERYVNFAKLLPGFTQLCLGDQSLLLKVGRCDFFNILMHEGYIEEYKTFLAHTGTAFHLEEAADMFFSRELLVSMLKIYHKWQNLELSKEEMALLISVALTFPDRCKLINRERVEEIQIRMLEMLQAVLIHRYKEKGLKRLAKMMNVFISLRDMSELYYNEYKLLCKNDLIIEEVPMVTEFFLEDW